MALFSRGFWLLPHCYHYYALYPVVLLLLAAPWLQPQGAIVGDTEHGNKSCIMFDGKVEPCEDTCCCNRPGCCLCNAFATHVVPCSVPKATHIIPRPNLTDQSPLYYECLPTTPDIPSTTSTTTTTTTATTTTTTTTTPTSTTTKQPAGPTTTSTLISKPKLTTSSSTRTTSTSTESSTISPSSSPQLSTASTISSSSSTQASSTSSSTKDTQTPEPSAPSSIPDQGESKGSSGEEEALNSTLIGVIAGLGAVAVLILCSVVIILVRKKKKKEVFDFGNS